MVIPLTAIAGIPVNSRTEYWLDLWDEQVRLYSTHTDGFDFATLATALNILIEDTTSASSHRAGIIRKTNLDILISAKTRHPLFRNSSLEADLTLLVQELERKQWLLVHERATVLLNELSSRKYSDLLVSRLKRLLAVDSPFSNRELRDLNELTRDSMDRLFRAGFDLRSIGSIPRRLFSAVTGEPGQKMTRFPREYLRLETGTGDPRTWLPLTLSEEAAVESLTKEQRIAVLADFMHPRTINYECVFSVDGFSGSLTQKVGEVELYSPVQSPKFGGHPNRPELFDQDPETCPINAYVVVAAVDREQAQEKGRAAVEHALDAINIALPPPPEVSVGPGRWIYRDPDSPSLYGFIEPTTPSAENLYYTTHNIARIDRGLEALHAPKELIEERPTNHGLVHQISTSLQWLRRAEASTQLENRLLFNWVAFEKLFKGRAGEEDDPAAASMSETIYEMFPLIDMYVYAIQLSEWPAMYADCFWGGALRHGHDLRLDADSLQSIYRISNPVSAGDFVEHIRSCIDDIASQRFKERMEGYLLNLDSGDAALGTLESLLKRSRAEMSIIYWLRNRLVHGGELTFPTLQYFVAILDASTRMLLRIVTDQRNWPADAKHPFDIILPLFIDATRVRQTLKLKLGSPSRCMEGLRRVYSTGGFRFRNPYGESGSGV